MAGAARLFQVREPSSRYGRHGNRAAHLTAARPEFPAVLGFRGRGGLPLEVLHGIGAAASERVHVILPVAGASAARLPGRRARMLALEFARYLTGSVLFRRKLTRNSRAQDRDDDRAASRHRQYRQYPVNHRTASVVSIAVAKMTPSVLRA